VSGTALYAYLTINIRLYPLVKKTYIFQWLVAHKAGMSLSMALNLNFGNHLAMNIVYFDITLAQSNEIHG